MKSDLAKRARRLIRNPCQCGAGCARISDCPHCLTFYLEQTSQETATRMKERCAKVVAKERILTPPSEWSYVLPLLKRIGAEILALEEDKNA